MWFSTDNAVAAPSSEQAGVAALSPNAMIEDERNSVSVYEAMALATVFVI
jgi:hypothetical protein